MADLFGNSTLADTSHKPEAKPMNVGPWLSFFSQLIGNSQANAMPPPRPDKPEPPTPKPEPGPFPTAPTSPHEAPTEHSETEPAPGTSSGTGAPMVNMASALTANAPSFDPEAGLPAWQRTSTMTNTGGSWLTEKPAVNSLRFQKPDDALAAIESAPDVATAAKISAANSDFQRYGGYRLRLQEAMKMPMLTEKNAMQAQALDLKKQAVENNTVEAKMKLSLQKDMLTRVGKLPPLTQGEIATIEDPKMKIEAIRTAEEAQALKLENERKLAELERLQAGDQQRTTITEKGVTKVFSPQPASSKTAEEVIPKEMTLSDGTKLVYNPKTGASKVMGKNGTEREMTFPQLLAVATEMRYSDPNKKLLMDFLGSTATNQISHAKGVSAPDSSKATGPTVPGFKPQFKWVPGQGLVPNQ